MVGVTELHTKDICRIFDLQSRAPRIPDRRTPNSQIARSKGSVITCGNRPDVYPGRISQIPNSPHGGPYRKGPVDTHPTKAQNVVSRLGRPIWTNQRGNETTTYSIWRVCPPGILGGICEGSAVSSIYRDGSSDSDDAITAKLKNPLFADKLPMLATGLKKTSQARYRPQWPECVRSPWSVDIRHGLLHRGPVGASLYSTISSGYASLSGTRHPGLRHKWMQPGTCMY